MPEGYLKTTILEAGGKAVPPTDVAAIKNALEQFFVLFEKHQLSGPAKDVIERYNRVGLTGDLVKIFESLFET